MTRNGRHKLLSSLPDWPLDIFGDQTPRDALLTTIKLDFGSYLVYIYTKQVNYGKAKYFNLRPK